MDGQSISTVPHWGDGGQAMGNRNDIPHLFSYQPFEFDIFSRSTSSFYSPTLKAELLNPWVSCLDVYEVLKFSLCVDLLDLLYIKSKFTKLNLIFCIPKLQPKMRIVLK